MTRSLKSFVSAACVALSCALALPAAAAEGVTDVSGLGTHQKHVRLDIGNRTQFVSDAGLDPFSTNDVIPQLSLSASWAFYASDELSVAALLGFDYGGTSAKARSN